MCFANLKCQIGYIGEKQMDQKMLSNTTHGNRKMLVGDGAWWCWYNKVSHFTLHNNSAFTISVAFFNETIAEFKIFYSLYFSKW